MQTNEQLIVLCQDLIKRPSLPGSEGGAASMATRDYDSYQGMLVGGLLYGRGTSDMKGAMVAAATVFKKDTNGIVGGSTHVSCMVWASSRLIARRIKPTSPSWEKPVGSSRILQANVRLKVTARRDRVFNPSADSADSGQASCHAGAVETYRCHTGG